MVKPAAKKEPPVKKVEVSQVPRSFYVKEEKRKVEERVVKEYDIPEFLKDPRFLRKGLETTWEEDYAILFPRIEDFNFDLVKYQEAIDFLKHASAKDPTRKLTKEQLERLYPSDQPEVFRRLISDAADAVTRFDLKLREIQSLTSSVWTERLES